MLYILICHPDKKFSKYLKNLLQSYFHKLYYDTIIIIFNNGYDFFNFYFKNNQNIDLIISEVDIPDFSTINLLNIIRNLNKNLSVILITNNYKEIYNLVEFKLTNYIIKDSFFQKKKSF